MFFWFFIDDYNKLLAKMKGSEQTVRLVDSSDVRIDKNLLATTKVIARTPCILTRHLFKALYTVEELVTHSLFGKKSNAKAHLETLPALDSNKRNAIFGKKQFSS